MREERWKEIPGYDYEISDHGRVRSMDRIVFDSIGRRRLWKGRILSLGMYPSYGYWIVALSKDRKQRTFNVHSLVASAFLPPRPIGTEVNHKDGNKANSYYTNLEWVTHSQNAVHSIQIGTRRWFVNCLRGKLTRKRNPNGILQKVPS